MNALYERLLERDLRGIRAAIREFRDSHSSAELFESISRFAVLAYAPSQHSKHALMSCVSAHDLGAGDDVLAECAIYAAMSRQPWSEAPITDPPPIESDQRGDIDELREAIASEDRHRAERWLAARAGDCRHDYFLAATDDFEDLGHKLIVAVSAWKLASMVAEQGRFATLRVGVWEMSAYRSERYEEEGGALDAEALFARLIDAMIANEGDIVSAHRIFLLDAALQTEDEDVIRRARDYLTNTSEAAVPVASGRLKPVLHPYSLARDYGAYLKTHAVATRLEKQFPDLNTGAMVAAAAYNLEHASSFEDLPFA